MKAKLLGGIIGLLLAFRAVVGAGTLSESAPLFTRIGDAVSIPAEISGHEMFVNVLVNGHGPFRVLVDTGCSVSLVSPELAAAVGAVVQDPDEELVAFNGLGDATGVQNVTLESIELGGVRFEGVPAAVTDSFDQLSALEGRRVDGALAFPLFADLFLGFDFPHQRLLLSRTWPGNLPPIRTSLPVVEHADVPYIQIQIQGTPVEVMIDTGANQALHLSPELASLFKWKQSPRAGSLVAVIGEVAREGIGRLAGSLSMGNVQQIEPAAVISPGTASIGLRSLDEFCVIFHQSENKVWFCGSVAGPKLPTAERTDGLSLYADPGGWRIAGVIPGSPADQAHLAAGTLVTRIEQRPAASWTRDEMQQWIDTHADVTLEVADQTGERALTLPAWVLLP